MSLKNVLNSFKKRDEKKERQKAVKNTAVRLGLGAAVGAVVGLLFAPKKGEETRKDVAEGVKKATGEAKKVAETVKTSVGEKVETLKTKVKDYSFKKKTGEPSSLEHVVVEEDLEVKEEATLLANGEEASKEEKGKK
jgi:gas vesicle protein